MPAKKSLEKLIVLKMVVAAGENLDFLQKVFRSGFFLRCQFQLQPYLEVIVPRFSWTASSQEVSFYNLADTGFFFQSSFFSFVSETYKMSN